MATHDYVLENAAGAAFRADINAALAAIVSQNSSATEPTTTYAYMWWADTDDNILKRRNAANSGWIDVMSLSTGLLIGFDVQAYDAATAKTNQDQQYTKPQRTTPLTDNDLTFDIGSGGAQDFVCTPTAGGTLTFTNIRAGAKGEILLVNNSNYTIAKAATVKCPASMLAAISATGRYRLAYSSLDGTNVDVTNSAALS